MTKKQNITTKEANKKIEKDWERSVMGKTNRYFRNLY